MFNAEHAAHILRTLVEALAAICLLRASSILHEGALAGLVILQAVVAAEPLVTAFTFAGFAAADLELPGSFTLVAEVAA